MGVVAMHNVACLDTLALPLALTRPHTRSILGLLMAVHAGILACSAAPTSVAGSAFAGSGRRGLFGARFDVLW